jgi:hypothetical protein
LGSTSDLESIIAKHTTTTFDGFAASENVVLQHPDQFVAAVCPSLGTSLDGTLPKVSTADVPLLMAALAARLRAAGNDISARDLVDRWNTYHRHLILVADYATDRVLTAPAVVIGADVSDGDLDEWVRRFGPAPEVRRLDADHFSVYALTGVRGPCRLDSAGRFGEAGRTRPLLNEDNGSRLLQGWSGEPFPRRLSRDA